MFKHSTDYAFSPLLLLVPLPFVLATFLPLEIDHSQAAGPKAQHVAAASIEHGSIEGAASAPHASSPNRPQHAR